MKAAAKQIGSAAVLTYLISIAPWVKLPVINAAFKWLISYILNVAIDKTEMGAFFLFIDIRTNEQGKAFAAAAMANREAQRSGTPEQKKQAEDALINSFRALIRLTN